jgi:hypothetical protein
MRALTYWRPWPWVIMHGGKPVENRPRKYPRSLHGELVAIHAGKHYDDKSLGFILRTLEATGKLTDDFLEASKTGGIVGVARLSGIVVKHDSPWFTGPYGWLPTEVRPLKEPIAIKGAQGFWRVPATVQRDIEAQLLEAAA